MSKGKIVGNNNSVNKEESNYKVTLKNEFCQSPFNVTKAPILREYKDESGETVVKYVKQASVNLPSKMEWAVILTMMSKVNSFVDNEFKTYDFTAKELLDECGIKKNLTDEQVFKLLESIGSYRIKIECDNYIRSVVFMPVIEKNKSTNKYSVSLHHTLGEFMFIGDVNNSSKVNENGDTESTTEGAVNFTSFGLKYVRQLESAYAIRLYLYFHSIKGFSISHIKKENLYKMLGLSDKYRYSDFRKKILEPAIEEINSKTDITVTYSEVKKGRAVYKLSFASNYNDKHEKDSINLEHLSKEIGGNCTPERIVQVAERIQDHMKDSIKVEVPLNDIYILLALTRGSIEDAIYIYKQAVSLSPKKPMSRVRRIAKDELNIEPIKYIY